MPSSDIIKHYRSWGKYPEAKHHDVMPVRWRNEIPDLEKIDGTVLPFGYGRSYGDSCLNNGGTLLDTTYLNQMIAFDDENGIICVEAGMSLAEIVEFIVPRGWFLPVTPGTKYVSVAGAVANDVHGKNHVHAGTFGRYVTRFELVRSNGERMICSPTENEEYYRATIGGMGLTGLMTWIEFTLKPIPSPLFDVERIRFGGLDEFFEIDADSAEAWPYTVSWVDTTAKGDKIGRGVYMRGKHYDPPMPTNGHRKGPSIRLPIDAPISLMNSLSIKALNTGYFHFNWRKFARSIEHYDPYFYPLDGIKEWNRAYGNNGFLQYQLCMPAEDRKQIKDIFRMVSNSGHGSFITVFKRFGDLESPGMLSFPQPGITLTMDFPVTQDIFPFLDRLDAIVRETGGRIYPAKDSRVSAENFQAFYPNWQEFANYVDPKFSSSFWRRVTGEQN